MEIRHFEVLVHPHFLVGMSAGYGEYRVDKLADLLAPLWDQRVALLSEHEDTMLIYHSAFPYNLADVRGNRQGMLTELDRRFRYRFLLKDRFILYGVFDNASNELPMDIRRRGFSYNRQSAQLLAYGQYYELCVNSMLKHTQQILGLSDEDCKKDSTLSVHFPAS